MALLSLQSQFNFTDTEALQIMRLINIGAKCQRHRGKSNRHSQCLPVWSLDPQSYPLFLAFCSSSQGKSGDFWSWSINLCSSSQKHFCEPSFHTGRPRYTLAMQVWCHVLPCILALTKLWFCEFLHSVPDTIRAKTICFSKLYP